MSSSCEERRRSRLFRDDTVVWSPATDLVAEVPAAVATAEEQAEEAWARGHAAGLAEGRADAATARSDVEERLASTLAAVHSLAGELQEARRRVVPPVAEEICAAALRIAEAVIGRELAVAEDPGADALVRALSAVSGPGTGRAHLNPDDLDALTPPRWDGGIELELVPDPSIPRGGCRLEVEDTVVDATTETALARVRAVLLGEEDA